MSFKLLFLTVAAAEVLRLSAWQILALVLGYLAFDQLDRWLARRARERRFEDEVFGWETEADDPSLESKGGLSRLRLSEGDRLLFARIAELLLLRVP